MPTAKQGVYTVGGNRSSVGTAGQSGSATTACCCAVCTGLQCLDRTRFFAGQLLSEADLNNDQSYWLAKNRLHNRYLNGWGVVCGMKVVCGDCDGWVTVEDGYAIDPCGNDVIVCADQNFNVLQAIQACCAPAKQQAANCSPLRYNPSPSCQDAQQEWCITIQYKEQASRLVTPLTNSSAQSSSSCGCGSSSGRCQGSSSSTSSGSSCKSSSTATSTSNVPAGSCEATRIVEGFQLGVVPAAEVAAAAAAGDPNSLKSQVLSCATGFLVLAGQASALTASTAPQSAYQITCTFLAQVKKYLSTAEIVTMCTILDDLSAITVPSGQDTPTYMGIMATVVKILIDALLDCLCLSVIPPCPVQPCDSRIVLACVTVQNGKVVKICHFPGRKQLITLHTLGYWLGPLGLDNLGTVLSDLFATFCCNAKDDAGFYRANIAESAYYNAPLTTAGITSGAAMNRIAAHYVAQNLGAQALQAFSPGTNVVDLRPMVNTPVETVAVNLRSRGFKSFTMQAVDEDPAWNADAVATSAQYAPAAVSAGQPLTVYTRGSVAVGFDVVDPTTAKIQDLQNQINALQSQMNQAQQTPGTGGLAAG